LTTIISTVRLCESVSIYGTRAAQQNKPLISLKNRWRKLSTLFIDRLNITN